VRPGPYFNSVPDTPDMLTDPQFPAPVRGVAIPAGASRTIDVRLFSNARSADWTVSVSETTTYERLTYAWDRSAGHNGDVLHLTIGPVPSEPGQSVVFVVRSTSTGSSPVTTFWADEVMITP